MDEKAILIPKPSYLFGSSDDSFYPVCFGASLAFFAVRVLSLLPKEVGQFEAKENLLKGSSQLMGLLAWRVEKEGLERDITEARLEKAERDVTELKKIRREDAKANEKVVGIFAAQEQTWLVERRNLRQHIGALITELKRQEKLADQATSEAEERLKETEASMKKSNEENLAEEREKRKESDRKMREAEKALEERSSDLRKYKTAFIELVSNQRRIEAEMGRAARQKEESVLMVQKLSAEMVKMHEDLEQKEKILSATMRRSKLDTAERQLLLKEVKLSKAKRKEAELESERWRAVSESRRERSSLRNMFAKHANSGSSIISSDRLDLDDGEGFDGYSIPSNEDIDVKEVENWVRSEAERYTAAIEQRHSLEINAFVEQMRLKDEKLEAFRWRHLSMELETKRLQSHLEALRHEAIKSQSLLSEREQELASLRIDRDRKKDQDQALTLQSPEDKEQDEPEYRVEISSPVESTGSTSESTCSGSQGLEKKLNRANSSQWKIDLHALGVSYKLKRLKQQFIMLERLRGTHNNESIKGDEAGTKDFLSLISFLNKQIGRYQSLQAKVDDLCKRMHESDLDLCREDSKVARTKEKTKILEHYLEETFQVQRYIVATGQKLVEVQAKIGSGFIGIAEELDKSTGFDLSRFSESVRSLFQDVQRGIEVRIARVIGDLEGTLACEGMISLRRW